MLKQIKQGLVRLHRDDKGEMPVGPLLVIGLIVIPLVIVLLAFSGEVKDFLKNAWGTITGASATTW